MYIDEEQEKALDQFLEDNGKIERYNPMVAGGDFPLIDSRDVLVKILNPGTPAQVIKMLPDILGELFELVGDGNGNGGGSTSGITVDAINWKKTSDDGRLTTYTMVFSNGNTRDFTVRNGVDYVLTDANKTEIIDELLARLPIAEEVSV